MAYDQKGRSNAAQKEAGKATAASCATSAQNCNTDTEFATDNWTGAVFDPDAIQANGRSYDPQTYTETYRSENGVDQSTSAMAQDQTPSYTVGTETTDHKSEQVAVASSYAQNNNATGTTASNNATGTTASNNATGSTAANNNAMAGNNAGGQATSAGNNAMSGSGAGTQVTSATGGNTSGQGSSANNDYVGYNMVNNQTPANSASAKNVNRATQYETAAEITPPFANAQKSSQQKSNATAERADGLGWTGMGLSILALFFLPYLMAPIGMIIGYLAFRRNARTLGTWAMIIGAIAILGALVVYPYYVAR